MKNYAYITSYVLRNKRLRVAEQWLIDDEEELKKLISLFKKDDFQQMPEFEQLPLLTAFSKSLSDGEQEKFFNTLKNYAEKENYETLEPFESFDETGISFETRFINNFFNDGRG